MPDKNLRRIGRLYLTKGSPKVAGGIRVSAIIVKCEHCKGGKDVPNTVLHNLLVLREGSMGRKEDHVFSSVQSLSPV